MTQLIWNGWLDLSAAGEILDEGNDLIAAHNDGEHTTSWDGCPTCDPDSEEAWEYEQIKENIPTDAIMEGGSAIPEHEWEEYAEDFAYDIGMIERDSSISYYIDWEKWADDLKMDYTTFDFDGITYYYR